MPRKLSDADSHDLVRRYVAGESTKQLGPAFGVSSRVVSDYLRRAGVKARPKHHGIVQHMAGLSHEQRSRIVSESMRRRWASASPEQRRQMIEPAHAASRGRTIPLEQKIRTARTREAKARPESEYEVQLAEWLTERDISFRQQAAVGPYNLDLAVGNVGIEVTTGWARKKGWNPKVRNLIDWGWHLYFVWHDTRVPLRSVIADDLVAWVQFLETSPPEGSQYRVVWRSDKILAGGRADADEIARVLKSATPLWSRTLD